MLRSFALALALVACASPAVPPSPSDACGPTLPSPPAAAPRQVVQSAHAGGVSGMAFGDGLATVGTDGTIRIWDPPTRALLRVVHHPPIADATVAWDSSARAFVASCSGAAWRLDGDRFVAAKRCDAAAPRPPELRDLHGKLVVIGGDTAALLVDNTQVALWSVTQPEAPPRRLVLRAPVHAIALSPAADVLYVVEELPVTRLLRPAAYDLREAAPTARELHGELGAWDYGDVTFTVSADGSILAAASQDHIGAWSTQTRRLLWTRRAGPHYGKGATPPGSRCRRTGPSSR